MLEVYDRVVNSHNALTFVMLTLAVIAAYVVMAVLDWPRSEIAFTAATIVEERLSARVFRAGFDASRQRIEAVVRTGRAVTQNVTF